MRWKRGKEPERFRGAEGTGLRDPRALWSDGQEGARMIVPRGLAQPTGWDGRVLSGWVEVAEFSRDMVVRGLGERPSDKLLW